MAKIILDYAEACFERSPILKQLIASRTADALELTNGITLEVRPASFRKLRGPTYVAVIADELRAISLFSCVHRCFVFALRKRHMLFYLLVICKAPDRRTNRHRTATLRRHCSSAAGDLSGEFCRQPPLREGPGDSAQRTPDFLREGPWGILRAIIE